MIATLTMNPAIDRLLFIDKLNKNNTTRILRISEALGGKGTHVSLNLAQLGLENDCYGVVMGETGRRIIEILRQHPNINEKMYYLETGESRTNYAIIERDHTSTLLSEKGETITAEVCEQVVDRLVSELEPGDDLVLSGDASNSEIPHIYNHILERLAQKDVRVYLDTSSENLINGIKLKPFMVKPNLDELAQYAGTPVQTEEEILGAMERIVSQGVALVAVTCGGDGSYVYYQNQYYRIEPIKIPVVNTIGCGDAYLSGIVYGINRSLDLEDVLRHAAAVSTATALCDSTVGFDLNTMRELLTQVEVRKL